MTRLHRLANLVRAAGWRPRLLALGAIPLLAPALGGCVNQQEYDRLYQTNRALEERNVALQQELESQESTVELLRSRVREADETLADARDRNAELNAELLRLEENYRSLNERLSNVAVTPLDPATDSALRELAATHGDIIIYDERQGMLRFRSDLTFASGSTELTGGARQVLGQLANVLAAQEGLNYDIRVVGHTDNVPVSRPATRAKHPTNMHLSVHRAISVRNALVDAGVSPVRVQAAGWGPYRPAVPNPPSGGVAANRRVEIYLVPSTADPTTIEANSPEEDEPAQAGVDADEPMK